MTIFGPGLILERTTHRPFAGRVAEVIDPVTDTAVETVAPVVTDAHGYYDEFDTVPDVEHVYLRVGTHVQHAVAIGRKLTDVSDSGTSVTDNGNGTSTIEGL